MLKNETFDVIQLESLFMAPYVSLIRKISSAVIVMRAHNAEFKIWERLAETSPKGLKKWYLKILARQLKKFELDHINSYDGIVAITPEDKALFISHGCTLPVHVTPIGINPEDYPFSPSKASPDELILFHLGSMDWMPNQEGIQWFIGKVWQGIHESFPGIKLYIAGRNMPSWLKQKQMKNLNVQDSVQDAKSFMANGSIMVVPLLSGSGMRVKIIEGMAMGKPVISTSIGAEGIEYTENKNMLIADTPGEFVEAIRKCVNNTPFMRSMEIESATLVREKYNNKLLASELLLFYDQLRSNKK
jgi:glycosyltransferase involved in cell wall biosynthesis